MIEDDRDIRETLLTLLSDDGYTVRACSNGLEALDALRKGRQTDVILLDLMMPVMDGWEFRVRQKEDPALAAIPVLVLSADGTAKATAIDADGYLRKPLDYPTLIQTIERTLVAAERVKLQSALAETERLASLGTLAAGIAHEINNPLTYLKANLEYIGEALDANDSSRDPARFKMALADARDGCERIRVIVRDLQLFSRASDDEDIDVDVDVRALLDSSANIVMNDIRLRARLVKDYEEVPLLAANPARLGQVFLNLVLNAVQSIPIGDNGKNEVRLTTRVSGARVVVQVSDTGQGIPVGIRARIFDPFFTTKPLGVGTGLGLSISHRIVSAMRGDLTVESEVGRGSTFSVRLPITASKPPKRPSAPVRVAKPRARPARLLVVDDEVMIGTLLKRVLSDSYEVEAMTSPDAATARIARGERFDLILCDITMPERSGIDVHTAISLLCPDQAERMMFLTGGALTDAARVFLAARGSSVITKPFVSAELQERINAKLAAVESKPAAG